MKKQYILSERAHFMCPNMHFGIVFEVAAIYKQEKVEYVLRHLVATHPFLNCMIAQEDNGSLYYENKGYSTIALSIGGKESDVWADYRAIGGKEWDVFHNGLLKVSIYPKEDSSFQILFVSHHLLCDGRALLQLVLEFADCYVEDKIPAYAEECLITSIADLPPKSDLSGISKMLVRRANREWSKEKHSVTYEEYSLFVEQFAKENPCGHLQCSIEEEKLATIRELCHNNGISVNDYLLAALYMVAKTQKIVIGADVRKDIACYQSGALGNYSSAIGIVCKDKNTEIIPKARAIHKIIEKYSKDKKKWLLVLACYLNMDADLLDAVAIATLGNFKSKAAKFVGSAMFGFASRNGVSMTNLGAIENRNVLSAMFIPPLSPSAKEVFGVLTVNGKMEIVGGFYKQFVSDEEMQMQLKSLML